MTGKQIEWGGLLVRLLKKHAKSLSLDVQWRPLYETLTRTHFKMYSSEHMDFAGVERCTGSNRVNAVLVSETWAPRAGK